jgi:type IV pilus assembly protein PilV
MTLRRREQGVALVEAIVAVVLLGIGLLGAIGMQARSMSALADSGMRAEATIAADRLIGMMTLDAANASAYVLAPGGTPGTALQPWYADTRTRVPNAQIEVKVAPAANRTRVEINITWTRKTGAAANAHHVVSYLAPTA